MIWIQKNDFIEFNLSGVISINIINLKQTRLTDETF